MVVEQSRALLIRSSHAQGLGFESGCCHSFFEKIGNRWTRTILRRTYDCVESQPSFLEGNDSRGWQHVNESGGPRQSTEITFYLEACIGIVGGHPANIRLKDLPKNKKEPQPIEVDPQVK